MSAQLPGAGVPAPGPTPEHRKSIRLAQAVLSAALERKWPSVQNALERLNSECGADGLTLALVAWCDSFVEYANGGMPDDGVRARLAAWNVDTGAVGAAERPTVQWATDLIAARAAFDEDQFYAVLGRLNAIGDGYQRGRHVLELIESIALTMRSLPRGFARMGAR